MARAWSGGFRRLFARADVREGNDTLAAFVARHRTRMVAFGTGSPFAGSAALEENAGCLRVHRMRGLSAPVASGLPDDWVGPARFTICE